jgi:hypothetical protein
LGSDIAKGTELTSDLVRRRLQASSYKPQANTGHYRDGCKPQASSCEQIQDIAATAYSLQLEACSLQLYSIYA